MFPTHGEQTRVRIVCEEAWQNFGISYSYIRSPQSDLQKPKQAGKKLLAQNARIILVRTSRRG